MVWDSGVDSNRSFGGSVGSSSGAEQARREAHDVNRRLERLILVNAALWSLLQDKTGLTEQDLLDRVKLLDGMDGAADGKLARGPSSKCEQCGRTLNSRHNRCLYCGAERRVGSAFELI